MPLAAGSTLGPYEIESPLGAGGMGEVYKARDTRLGRPVAIKVISPLLAGTPELRERFVREARAISQLTHPHICTLHDIGHDRGIDYLVLELLEGETLAERLLAAGGAPLPVHEAVQIGLDICDALDKAHRHGIVHRDLKPGNVFLARKGNSSRSAIAKLLDFGLAKNVSLAPVSVAVTRTSPATAHGAIVGTLQYMSPEQAEGREADTRSDIFSFGALLYEMVTGQRAFPGDTPASVISAILRDTPRPIGELVPVAPRALDKVVRRCLEKDPDDRWQSARDVMLVLGDVLDDEREERRAPAARGWLVGALATAVVAVGVAGWLWVTRAPAPAPAVPMRLSMMLPDGYHFRFDTPTIELSPDGQHLALGLTAGDGVARLFVRSLDSHELRAVPGTEGGTQPFWSPDGRHLAFFAGGRLKRVPVTGGPVQIVCDAAEARGAAWGPGDVMLFSPGPGSGVFKVPASGGQPQPVTTPASRQESHRYPSFLPGGRRFLYLSVGPQNAVYVTSLDGGTPTRVVEADTRSVYAAGHLLFVRAGVLMAQPFDVEALRTDGEAEVIGEEVDAGGPPGSAAFTAARNGIVTYVSGATRPARDLVWRRRSDGEVTGRLGETRRYLSLSFSPDDRRLAVGIEDPHARRPDLWEMNVARGVGVRLSSADRSEWFPIWSRDGRRLFFRSGQLAGSSSIIVRGSDGAERALESELFPTSIAADGVTVIGHSPFSKTGWDIYALGNGTERPIVAGPYTDVGGVLSPDGRWLAWTSDESGAFEVFVAQYPDGASKQRVSNDGGTQPAWRGDGRELFYVSTDGHLMAVEVSHVGDELELAAAKRLFRAPVSTYTSPFYNNYAVTSDGLRFLTVESPPHAPPVSVRVYTGLAAKPGR